MFIPYCTGVRAVQLARLATVLVGELPHSTPYGTGRFLSRLRRRRFRSQVRLFRFLWFVPSLKCTTILASTVHVVDYFLFTIAMDTAVGILARLRY